MKALTIICNTYLRKIALLVSFVLMMLDLNAQQVDELYIVSKHQLFAPADEDNHWLILRLEDEWYIERLYYQEPHFDLLTCCYIQDGGDLLDRESGDKHYIDFFEDFEVIKKLNCEKYGLCSKKIQLVEKKTFFLFHGIKPSFIHVTEADADLCICKQNKDPKYLNQYEHESFAFELKEIKHIKEPSEEKLALLKKIIKKQLRNYRANERKHRVNDRKMY